MITEMDGPAYMLILIIVSTTLDYSDENPLILTLGGFVSCLPSPLLDQIWINTTTVAKNITIDYLSTFFF